MGTPKLQERNPRYSFGSGRSRRQKTLGLRDRLRISWTHEILPDWITMTQLEYDAYADTQDELTESLETDDDDSDQGGVLNRP